MSVFADPTTPSAADFATFVANQLTLQPGWPSSPGFTSSQWQGIALAAAEEVVNDDLVIACAPVIYTLCVYNLALDILLNITPDAVGQTVMAQLRKQYKIDEPQTGMLTSASNDVSSASVLNPDFMKGLTMTQLQNAKTPWGRFYIGYAASVGSLWGLS